ncbi:hypothetical protein FRZ06_10675 [Anoxybacterium hadale]|uniref:Uncharacterized protein n=1 Tax=Anoxybacterium hadale TaxID=3408580 RepID=A0ACD1ABI9_9FIRM|nr:hypothetical protein FRZ06_10675 [Clostridiales bacterium]
MKQILIHFRDKKILWVLLACVLFLSGLGIYRLCQKDSGESDVPVLPKEQKVAASPEVLAQAQQKVDETIQFYTSGWNLLDDNGSLAAIKILDSEITNLQLAKRVDIYDRLVGQRVIDGIKSAYEEFYYFSYRLLPDANVLKGKSLSFELDKEGWISFEKTTPYTADSAPGDLILIVSYVDDKITGSNVVRIPEFSDPWCVEYLKEHFPDYDADFNEDAYRTIDEYSFIFEDGSEPLRISLNDKQYTVPSYLRLTNRKVEYTDYFADYSALTEYEDRGNLTTSGEIAGFLIQTLHYNMPDSKEALAVVSYMCTDRPWGPKTYRGISVGSSQRELLRLYPDDLYYLRNARSSDSSPIGKRNKGVEYAYFYYPDDQTSNDITFYIKNGKVSSIEMIAAYERRYVYDGAGNPENLVNQPVNKKSAFQVETLADFSKDIELPWEKLGDPSNANPPYISHVKIRLPKVSDNVPNGDAINANIDLELYQELLSQLEAGDDSPLYQGRLAEYSVDYEVHTWKNTAALVLNEAYGIVDAGGGRHRIIWYYDNETGNILSPRQYAQKCGIGEASIIKQYNDNSVYGSISSVYEANFYVDEAGKIVTFENLDT